MMQDREGGPRQKEDIHEPPPALGLPVSVPYGSTQAELDAQPVSVRGYAQVVSLQRG